MVAVHPTSGSERRNAYSGFYWAMQTRRPAVPGLRVTLQIQVKRTPAGQQHALGPRRAGRPPGGTAPAASRTPVTRQASARALAQATVVAMSGCHGYRLRVSRCTWVLASGAVIVTLSGFTVSGASPPDGARVSVDATRAKAGQLVTISLVNVPRRSARVRLYLLPSGQTAQSRFDRKLHYLGAAPARQGRARLKARVPPLPSGRYALWCSGCGPVVKAPTLIVATPAATSANCPASRPVGSPPPGLTGLYYGNDALWTWAPAEGRTTVAPDEIGPDGSIGLKLYWWALVRGTLIVSGKRIDAASRPLVVHDVNEGRDPAFRGSATWATPVTFPSAGCWRVAARVDDIKLTQILWVGPATDA